MRVTVGAACLAAVLALGRGSALALQEDKGEKERLAVCERDLCGILAKPEAGADLPCNPQKTWAGKAIKEGVEQKKLSWGFGDVRCTMDLKVSRQEMIDALTKPEYEFKRDGGTVTWPINRGVLVARRGRGRGYLRLTVRRKPAEDGAREVTVVVSSEVVNFYPTLATRIGRWIYEQTQLRIHVIVTHAFLRSLANLELEPSRVGALRAAAEAAISPVVRR